ncbi:MAG: glycosyltransferase, partial [Candidatus Omnitrophica bacterium]|nr:glycosyltransferase [Candidatus Omnitrophota bacterium]MBD3269546.1 glycosyltransferase [Candidatus Omnitrophota bacterium]
IIPTYNEAKNIELLTDKIFESGKEFSILIIDDNSPDGTWQKVLSLQKKYPNLRLIKREQKKGLGSAYRLAFREVLKGDYDIILQMDADLSHDPAYIAPMLQLMKNYDVVIGSRYIRGGGVFDWSFNRLLLSRIANVFSRIVLRVPVYDITSGFKCMRRKVLEDIIFDRISSRGYFFQIETTFYSYKKGFRLTELPIVFSGRRKDISKMSLGIILEGLWKILFLSFSSFFSVFHKSSDG